MPTSLALVVCLLLAGVAPASAGPAGDQPSAKHVIHISGTRHQGFHVTWSDGEQWWTTTLSEALAECAEYHREARQARCAAHERTRHRWMGVLKRSLRHARGGP